MAQDQKRKLVRYLINGNTIEELAELYIGSLPEAKLKELVEEVERVEPDDE